MQIETWFKKFHHKGIEWKRMIKIKQLFRRDRYRNLEESEQNILPSSSREDTSYQAIESEESSEVNTPALVSNLNQFQVTGQSLISQNYLLRQWHFTNFAARFALWGIKHKAETSMLLVANKPVRLFWLSGEGVPLTLWSKIRLASFIKDFFNHTSFIICSLEPAILTGLLLHDLGSYGFFPEERCGTSLPAILDGLATNQITWSSHFGSDVLHEVGYWTWTGVLLLPPISGLVAAFLGDKQRKKWRRINGEVTMREFARLDAEPSFYRDTLDILFPWSVLRVTLANAKFVLLWDGRKHNDASAVISFFLRQDLVAKLITLTSPSRCFLLRLHTLRLLAQIAESFHPQNLERFIEEPVQKATLARLRQTILMALKARPFTEPLVSPLAEAEEADGQLALFEESIGNSLSGASPSPRWLAHYFIWTLGETEHSVTHLFWIPALVSSAYTLYAISRYIQLITLKAINLADYVHSKTNCEAEGKNFIFLQQNERYECVTCDWPFVSYKNSFTAQDCLAGLLQQTMNATELLHHLAQLPVARKFTTIDFSQQAWPTWNITDWEQFLINLESMTASPLELLDVSLCTLDNCENEVPSQQHIQALANLLMKINVTRFDISHQLLGDELVTLLLNPLAKKPLVELHLTDIGLTDVGATSLANFLSEQFQNLSNLQLASNQVTDLGIQSISDALHINSSLRVLNIADNPFSDSGLQRLAQGVQRSFIQTLNLSAAKFSVGGVRNFSDTLKENSPLQELTISNADLTAKHVVALQTCLRNLTYLDVSNNLLEDKAIQLLVKYAGDSLKTLNVAGNAFTDLGAAMIAEDLPATSLQQLDISGSQLTQQGFTSLVRALPNTQLQALSCVECGLDDQEVAELTAVFSNSSLLLNSLNLNDNELTNITLMKWLDVLPKTSLRELKLKNNQIDGSIASRLAQVLSKLNLTLLDLSHNKLDGHFFKEIAPALKQSHLKQLMLNSNKADGEALNNLAEGLVQLPCHTNDLSAPSPSRQAKRVFYPMKPNTALTQLDITDTDLDMDASAIRSYCRVASSLPGIRFLEREPMQRLDWRSCKSLPRDPMPVAGERQTEQSLPMKTTTILTQSFLLSLLCAGGILCVIALLYASYRASRTTYRFFRPAPQLRLPLDEADSVENVSDNVRPSCP